MVDDDARVRAGLIMMLDGVDGISIVDEAADGDQVMQLVDAHAPDVILMDIRLPKVDGIAATAKVRRRPNPAEVLVLTTFDTDDHVVRALRASATGFLPKDTPPAKNVAAIHAVADGAISPQVMRRLMDRVAVAADQYQKAQNRLKALTEREVEVVRAVATGLSNAEIATALHMSVATVKAHISSIEQAWLGQLDTDRAAGSTMPGSTEEDGRAADHRSPQNSECITEYMVNFLYIIYTQFMTDTTARRLTGFAGILAAILGIVLVPLYFTYSGPPPAWNVLTRNLINMIAAVAILVFLLGLAHLVRRAGARYDWFASVISGAGVLYAAITLVAISLETGVVLQTTDGTVDPTVDGPVAHANMLLHGSIARLLTAVTLFAAGAAIVRSGILPRWIGRAAYVVAVINLAFVPAMFFGDDAAHFYSAVGWGTAATAATLVLYWALAAGIAALRHRRPVETPGVRHDWHRPVAAG
jgi:DNA-binding NarL/FixJ family response regulator